jgi:hypothetical protein
LQERVTGATQRTIEVWEDRNNAKKLSDNKWNFQIAKSVNNGDGSTSINVVWMSKTGAPRTKITWQDVYALNWTAVVPDPGISVTVSGEWQSCSPGQSFDLDENGFWVTSPKHGPSFDPKFMNVGEVLYKYKGVDGIHIVIGVQNPSGDFDTIYVDPTSLPPSSSAKYLPLEFVEWWYQTDNRTSTMMSGASTAIGGVDFTKPAETTEQYYYSTTYDYDSGTWITSEDKPPQALYTAAAKDFTPRLYGIYPLILGITFGVSLHDDEKQTVSTKLEALLKVLRYNATVQVVNNVTFEVTINAPSSTRLNSDDIFATVTHNVIAAVQDLLKFEAACGDLPDGETWTVTKTGGGQ